MSTSRWGRRVFRGVVAMAVLGVFGAGVLLALLWLEHGRSVTLPVPTGSFAVGRSIFTWKDDATPDRLAPVQGATRELLVWIWYPAAGGASAAITASAAPAVSAATADDYVPAAMREAAARVRGAQTLPGLLMSSFLTRDAAQVRTHSTRDADVSLQERSYPVVIMRAGASAGVTNYTTLAEDLASHGYVVVGFDAPYRTGVVVFPDGRVMRRSPENNPELCSGPERYHCLNRLLDAWTGDIGFVLDRLARLNDSDASGKFRGRLDMTRVGVFGHSFGGAQAAQFCHDDSRCKAGIDVDGILLGNVVQGGIHQPFMFLLSDHGDLSSDAEGRQIYADMQSVYQRLPTDGRLFLEIRGANHFTFSDDGAVLKSEFVRGLLRVFGQLRIDGRRQLDVTTYCVHSFFDTYLKGAGRRPLEISSSLYPEIQVMD